jgi:diguanylate cyclase (GGDEF)-like protein/PAS domain S-box-containing protein
MRHSPDASVPPVNGAATARALARGALVVGTTDLEPSTTSAATTGDVRVPTRTDTVLGTLEGQDPPPLKESVGFSSQYLASHDESAALHLLRMLVSSSSDLVIVVDVNGQLVYANPAGERILGFKKMDDLDRDMFSLIHPDDQEAAAIAFIRDVTEPGTHPPAVYRILTSTGDYRFLEIVATNCVDDPTIQGVVLNARDITTSENLFRTLKTFGQANQVLVHATDEDALLGDTCTTIVDAGGYSAAWVGYVMDDEEQTVRIVASAGNVDHLKDLEIHWADDERGQGPAGIAIRTGKVQLIEDLGETDAPLKSREAIARAGLKTACVLPLKLHGDVVGILSIFATAPRSFDDPELRLFEELADALSYGISRIRDAKSLAVSEERFRSLATSSPIGIIEATEGGWVTYANRRICEIAGVDKAALMGMGWIASVHPEDRPELLGKINFAEAASEVNIRFRLQRPNGKVRHVRMSAAPKAADLASDYVVTIEDVTDEVLANEELTRQALFDPLTDLPNRPMFLMRLRQELAERRRSNVSIAVLFLDLDRFKLVNDSFGHDAGDTVLREVSRRFLATIRGDEVAARFGGDEFMFLIKDVHHATDALGVAQRLLDALTPPIDYEGGKLSITASIGVVVARRGQLAEHVLRDADTAMYHAKSSGKNRFELFDDELHRRTVSRLEMEGDLRLAIDRSEFELHYQPILEPRSGRPVGAEALLRWNHPTKGVVAPLEFIPVAEDSGLILEIGSWVFERAVSQLSEWDGLADMPRLEMLSVNFSARQLEDHSAESWIAEALDRHHVAPSRLEIEVTESVAMADPLVTQHSLEGLRDLGLHVSIDDFGTGYSSLAYLHTLPIATVKIDRSFIERLSLPEGSSPVVRAILDMSHAMGLRVIAEGVSSESLRAKVAAMGCDLAQGFFWSEPKPASDFAAWWREAVHAAPVRTRRLRQGRHRRLFVHR